METFKEKLNYLSGLICDYMTASTNEEESTLRVKIDQLKQELAEMYKQALGL